jgi:PHP domain
MAGSRFGWGAIVAVAVAIVAGSVGAEDAIDRLAPERVAKVHAAVEAFAAARKPLERGGDLHEYRCNLHVHSAFSHDSRGKIGDIIAAAKRAGTDALLFTEHPAAHYDFVADGHSGIVDGVLLVPGAETKGMLVYPRSTVPEHDALGSQDLVRRVRAGDGMMFLCHLEERMDWSLDSLTGCEIYNTHADAKEETRLYQMMKNPLWLVQAKKVLDAYPQEALAAIFDPPVDYLRRFDELCAVYPHTGVSGNDAHENVGLRITLLEGDKVRIADALDEELTVLDRAVVAVFTPIPADAKPGDLVFKLQLDPYEQSLRHVGTHVLATELSREAIQEGLVKGRAFVAFDWIADARGFDFHAEEGNGRHEMGSHVRLAGKPVLVGKAPLPGHWKVFNRGEIVHEADGETFSFAPTAVGNHRVELWLDVAGRPLPWVLANPIYVE